MTVIKRMISSWFGAAFVLLMILSKHDFSPVFPDKSFASDFNIIIFLLLAAALFILITFLKRFSEHIPTDNIALTISVGLYATALSYKAENISVALALTVGIAIPLFYVMYRESSMLSSLTLSRRSGIICASVIALLMAIFIAAVTCARYLTFSSPNYDFGIFCNMFASMARDFTQTVSSERDAIIQHFQVHFSPIYYLMLPFYMIFRSPLTLQILQALIVASGIIPLYFISRRRGLSPLSGVFLSAVYALFPALSGGCMYDLHENCFLAPLLLWLFYAAERRDRTGRILMFVFAVLTLCVKEDAAVYVAFFAIYLMISDGHDCNETPEQEAGAKRLSDRFASAMTPMRINGAALLILSIAWFGFTSWFLTKFGYGIMSYRYDNFISGDDGLIGVIRTVIVNPALVFSESFDVEKLTFLAQILLPLAAIPFVTKRPHRLLLLLPFVLINLMSDYQYQHSIFFQYVFGSSAFLFYASALNLADMSAKLRRTLLSLALASSLIFFSAFMLPKDTYIRRYMSGKSTYDTLEAYLDTVPDDASVTASTFLLPHMADRHEIYQLNDKNETDATTDYVVFDLRWTENSKADTLEKAYTAKGYETLVRQNKLVMILEKK